MSIQLHPTLRARFAALALDQELAAGRDPIGDGALSRRAAVLSSRRGRRRTAAGLRRAIAEAGGGPRLSAAVACDREAVAIAGPALQQLERAIRARGPKRLQGLALASLLLTDPESPLYRAARPERLYEASRTALLTLRPTGEVVRVSERRARPRVTTVG